MPKKASNWRILQRRSELNFDKIHFCPFSLKTAAFAFFGFGYIVKVQTEDYSSSAEMKKTDSLEDRIREAIDSADPVAAVLAESKSKGGLTPIIAVATYCDGEGFLRDYRVHMNVIERSGRLFIHMSLFDALKEVYEEAESTGVRCSRRKLKNVSKKFSIKKKQVSYTDDDITIVRSKSQGRDGSERLSNKLYYRAVITQKIYGRREINFPLQGQVRSECFKQAKAIRNEIRLKRDLIELLEHYHPKSKLLPKLRGLKSVEAEPFRPSVKVVRKLTLEKGIAQHLLVKKKKGRSPHTIRQAKGILNRFQRFMGEVYIEDITEEDVEEFLDTEPPAKSFNHFFRAVNGLFRWAIKKRHIRMNPCFCLELQENEMRDVAVLSCEECRALLEAARHLCGGEMLPYVALIIFAAIRPDSEMRHITWEKINFEDGEIRVLKGKRKKKRTVVMSANLICWLKICDQSRPIYPSSEDVFKRKWAAVRRAAGFRGGTKVTHSKKAEVIRQKKAEELARKPWVKDYGRHTGISCHVREHGDIGQTATWAGNSREVIEEDYLSLVPGSQAKEFWSIMP